MDWWLAFTSFLWVLVAIVVVAVCAHIHDNYPVIWSTVSDVLRLILVLAVLTLFVYAVRVVHRGQLPAEVMERR